MLLVKETPYRCDNCGKVYIWIKGTWIALTIFFGRGYAGYEHEFHLCSEECCNALQKKPKNELKKLAWNVSKNP